MKKAMCLTVILLVPAVISFVFADCSDYDADATVEQAFIKDAAAVNFIKDYTTREPRLDGSLLLRYYPDSEKYTVIDDEPDSSAYVTDE